MEAYRPCSAVRESAKLEFEYFAISVTLEDDHGDKAGEDRRWSYVTVHLLPTLSAE